MKFDTSAIMCSPKTTVLGLCGFLIAALQCMHFDAAGHLAMTQKDWFGLATGVLFAVVNGLSHDAPQPKGADGVQNPQS